MKIQLITEQTSFEASKDVTLSTFDAPRSLDEFDVNVIDLSHEKIWHNTGEHFRSVNRLNDFRSIQTMVAKKCRAKVLFVLPQNGNFYYHYGYVDYNDNRKTYLHSVVIKDHIEGIFSNIIEKILPTGISIIHTVFEPTETDVASNTYTADFYFEANYPVLTESNYSDKATTIEIPDKGVYLTTLNIMESTDMLLCFLHAMFGIKEKSAIPAWMSSVRFGDDDELSLAIKNSLDIIQDEKQKIDLAQQKIEKNDSYKSIIYTNGDELVGVIFEILEKLFDCDLSGFTDEKKEDFLIKLSDCTFIGEIKGITSNVKSEHISQLDVHFQTYKDKLTEEEREENVHQLLIINPFRTKPLEEREPVNQQQIDLAERNGCLIIETNTLLRIFEKFCRKEITVAQCVATFSNCTGLLQLSDFEKIDPDTLEPYKA